MFGTGLERGQESRRGSWPESRRTDTAWWVEEVKILDKVISSLESKEMSLAWAIEQSKADGVEASAPSLHSTGVPHI